MIQIRKFGDGGNTRKIQQTRRDKKGTVGLSGIYEFVDGNDTTYYKITPTNGDFIGVSHSGERSPLFDTLKEEFYTDESYGPAHFPLLSKKYNHIPKVGLDRKLYSWPKGKKIIIKDPDGNILELK